MEYIKCLLGKIFNVKIIMPFDTIENVLHWTRQASGAYKIKRQNSVSVYVFHN